MRTGFISSLSLMMMLACGVKKDKNNDNSESQTDESGSDVESVGEKISTDSAQSGITILMADTPLPECTDKNRGQTFYVSAESLFRYCDNTGAWTVIDLKGAKGDIGNTGLPSTPGANWAMYSGATRMGKTLKNPLDIGLTTELDTEAFFTELEPRTYMSARLYILTWFGQASTIHCNYHKTSDCSGPCYSLQKPLLSVDVPAPKIVAQKYLYNDPNPPLYIFDFSQVTTDTFNSIRSMMNGSCIDLSSSPNTESAVAGYPYTLPNGVSYPLTNINFKAE